jgi:hypothetical protein
MATKETFYFSHDYNSRNDPKMVSLLMKTGVVGIGVYWCIIEMLYEQGGYIQIEECERIAFELRTENELVLKIIESNLFGRNKEMFWSESVIRRLNVRKVKSARARESANYRWNDANGMRTQSDSNAIKESKGKESKGKNGVKGKENQMPVVGIKIEDDKVFFNDGSDRTLTLSEQSLLSMNELKPEKITK